MASSDQKVCPLCGTHYGNDADICAKDGRQLVPAGDAVVESAIQLSSATEQLLGDILTAPPAAADGEIDVEATIAQALPLEELASDEPDDEPEESTVIGPPPSRAVIKPALMREVGSLPAPAGELGSRGANDLFSDLQLEVGSLDSSADDEVTQRRGPGEEAEATVRSEMPPEFVEVLKREGELEAPISPGPSDKVKIDDAELGQAMGRGKDDKPKRPLPRFSQLQVQQVEYRLDKKRPLWPFILAGVALGLVVLGVVWALVS